MTSLSTDDQAIIVVCVLFVGYPVLVLLTATYVYLRKQIHAYQFEKQWAVLKAEAEGEGEEDLQLLKHQILEDQTMSIRARVKKVWESSIMSFLWNCMQAFLTLVACWSYVQELYEAPDVPHGFLVLEGFLSTIFLIDMVLLYYLAADKLSHLLSVFPFFDWISILPFFFFWGFGNPFLVGETNASLLFLRSLRIFRSFRVVRLYRLIPIVVERDTVKAHLFQIIITICGLIYIAVGAMQFFENNLDPIHGLTTNSPFPWHTAFYFMIVTLTTVGYGDITPVTEPGRAVLIIFLIWSVSLIPYTVGALGALMETANKYDLVQYSGGRDHIIVIGDLTGDELSLFLKEWYHGDANHHNAKVVIVSVRNPARDLERTLSSGLGDQMVTYVKGSPLDEYVLLKRAKIKKASFCLILTRESHPLILTYLAVKSLNKEMKVIVRTLDALLQSHFPIEGKDIAIRPSEVRRSLAASSVLLPGAASLLPGLLFSLSEKDMIEVESGSWKEEFMHSLSNELYSFPCPASLNDMTFASAVLSLYRSYHVILVASTVEIKTNHGSSRKMILLNPRSSVAKLTAGSMMYVIAQDYTFMLDLFGVNWNPFGALSSTVPQSIDKLRASVWQDGGEGQEELKADDEELGLLDQGAGYSSLRVTVDTGVNGGGGLRVGFQDLGLEDDGEEEKERKENRFINTLQEWNAGRDVTFYEHVVLGFRSHGGINWEGVYMLLDHLRPKNQVVFEPEPFARKKSNVSDHLLFTGPAEGFLELVGPLRLYHSKSHPIIVAVFVEDDPDLESAIKIARSFNDIYVVLGSGHDITTAFFCGVDRCAHICVAPKASAKYGVVEDDPYLVDAETVFTVRFVKRLFKKMKKPPPTFQVELCYHDNTRFLEIDDEETPLLEKDGEQQKEDDCCCGRCRVCRTFCIDLMFCRQYKRWWRNFHKGAASDLPPLERVVGSGSVFFSSALLRMLVSTFNGDGGVYELFLLFLRKSRFPETLDYSATLRLIAVPAEFVGESFADMFYAYASKPNPVILIGLYRSIYEEGQHVHYAVANPQPTFLREDDRVYALLNDQNENLMQSMYASMG